MNRLLLSYLILAALAVVFADDKYTTKYDKIDLDPILKNDRILRNYLDCCLGKGKCTADGEELKSHITDAMENDCNKCSDTQKKAVKKVIRKLHQDKPEWWKEVCDHFDPEMKYRTRYQKLVDEN